MLWLGLFSMTGVDHPMSAVLLCAALIGGLVLAVQRMLGRRIEVKVPWVFWAGLSSVVALHPSSEVNLISLGPTVWALWALRR